MAAVSCVSVLWVAFRRRLQCSSLHSVNPGLTVTALQELKQLPITITRTPSRVSLAAGQSRFGLDIGGSLLKLIYLEMDGTSDDVVHSLDALDGLPSRSQLPSGRGVREPALTVHVPALGGKLHFAHFATRDVEAAVDVLRRHRLCEGIDTMQATGGGSHKFRKLFEEQLETTLHPCNELDAVVLGICLMAKAVSDECYTMECVADPAAADSENAAAQTVSIGREQLGFRDPLRKIHKPFSNAHEDFFPFLLCNVGTGVSILHVQSETEYTRVSGTALGGGTFLGLTRLLTAARRFQDALDSAGHGDARRVDMLVADIYGAGEDRSGLALPGDLTASFFAKSTMRGDAEPRKDISDDDICKARACCGRFHLVLLLLLLLLLTCMHGWLCVHARAAHAPLATRSSICRLVRHFSAYPQPVFGSCAARRAWW